MSLESKLLRPDAFDNLNQLIKRSNCSVAKRFASGYTMCRSIGDRLAHPWIASHTWGVPLAGFCLSGCFRLRPAVVSGSAASVLSCDSSPVSA